jgi:hypothetical protein
MLEWFATHQAALVVHQVVAVDTGWVVDTAGRAGVGLRPRLTGVGVTTCARDRLQGQERVHF